MLTKRNLTLRTDGGSIDVYLCMEFTDGELVGKWGIGTVEKHDLFHPESGLIGLNPSGHFGILAETPRQVHSHL